MRPLARFYFDQFLFGFARCVPLVLALLFVFALLFLPQVNGAFGMATLIWPEDRIKQAAVGFALAVVVVQPLAAAYLIETTQTPPADRPCLPGFCPATTNGLGILVCTAI